MRRLVASVILAVSCLGPAAPLPAAAASADPPRTAAAQKPAQVGRPFEADPLAPYRQLTSSWAATSWTVYACGPESGRHVDLDAVVADFNRRVSSLFERDSGGLFVPRFHAGGVLPNSDTCANDAKGKAVILLRYAKSQKAWGVYHGDAPEVSIRDGRIVHSDRRVVTIHFRTSESDPLFVGSAPVAHEVGHTLGWAHNPIDMPGANPYSNYTNVMSGGHSVAAWYRYVAGWTEAVVHTSTRTYDLKLPAPAKPGLVAVPTGEVGKLYTVSVGPDGVEVHRVDFSPDSPLGHCASLKRKGFPLCFVNGTEVRAVAPPPPREPGESQQLPLTYPRKIGWPAGSVIPLPAAGVKVHVEDVTVGSDGSVVAARVRVSGSAPALWPRDWAPPVTDGSDGSGSGSGTSDTGSGSGSGSGTDAGSGGFSDTRGHLFAADITRLAESGITRGCNPPANTRFCPDDYVTRGQMAAFLVRAFGLPRPSSPPRFADTDGHLFAADVAALADAGVTRGCNPPRNDRFCPDAPVTRGEMAAFLVRALGLPPAPSRPAFRDMTSHVFASDAAALADAGITRGCNPPANDRFCPDRRVTRGEMAAFLVRSLPSR